MSEGNDYVYGWRFAVLIVSAVILFLAFYATVVVFAREQYHDLLLCFFADSLSLAGLVVVFRGRALPYDGQGPS